MKDCAQRSARDWRNSLQKMSPAQRQIWLNEASGDELRLLHQSWGIWAREKQLPPAGDWRVWLLLAGRGFGKTRAGAEWINEVATMQSHLQIALVGATFDDVRHVMVEGASGILNCAPVGIKPRWLPSQHKLIWPNGSVARCFAAESPRQLRGPEFHYGWADEIAKWRYVEAWDNLMMALRCGDRPRLLATTTPRPLGWLAKLTKAADTALVTGRTDENKDNLSSAFMQAMKTSYGDSALARQELQGELLAELPGALWSRAQLEGLQAPMPERHEFIRIVVGVDPAIGGANETGIIIAGKTARGHIWVLADHSLHAPPHKWAQIVQSCFWQWRAEAVIVEVNQGGDLVEHLLRQQDRPVVIRRVRAMKSKSARAEPVAAAYGRGEISHAGAFPELVDQMVNFNPAQTTLASPDRVDAAVWAIQALLTGAQTQSFEMPI